MAHDKMLDYEKGTSGMKPGEYSQSMTGLIKLFNTNMKGKIPHHVNDFSEAPPMSDKAIQTT